MGCSCCRLHCAAWFTCCLAGRLPHTPSGCTQLPMPVLCPPDQRRLWIASTVQQPSPQDIEVRGSGQTGEALAGCYAAAMMGPGMVQSWLGGRRCGAFLAPCRCRIHPAPTRSVRLHAPAGTGGLLSHRARRRRGLGTRHFPRRAAAAGVPYWRAAGLRGSGGRRYGEC